MSAPINVFYCQLSADDDPGVYDRLLHSLPGPVQQAIARYADEHDRRLRIAGKALLQSGLRRLDPLNRHPLEQYRHPAGQKPFFAHSSFRFSISHSGHVALCAIAKDAAVGADVEKSAAIETGLLRPYFNDEQWQNILQAADIQEELYRQWTIKEAGLKAWGIPIGEAAWQEILIGDKRVRFAGAELQYRMLPLVKGYTICIAAAQQTETMACCPVHLTEL